MKKQIKNHYKNYGCSQQIKDYSALSKFIDANYKSDHYDLKCDLIRPRLKVISFDKGKCKTIGEYFLQFGSNIYIQFLKTKIPHIQKKSKGDKNKQKKKKKSAINALIDKLLSHLKVKKIKSKLITLAVNSYYNINCGQIVSHYNSFYDFYQLNYSNMNEEHKNIAKCDFFIRLSKPSG